MNDLRIGILKFLYLFFLVAITLRLFYWQVFRFDEMTALAEGQHLVSYDLEAPRGTIFASDHSILASNKPTFLLYGLPKMIQDKGSLALKLAKVLTLENSERVNDLKKDLYEKLSTDLSWVSLNKEISLSTKQNLEKINLRGIGFERQSSRFYPESSAAAHLLGFVGSDTLGHQIGYFGVEGFYDGQLKGVGGEVTEEKDAKGFPILTGKFFKREPKNGRNLVLHLDRGVQYIVEKKLKAGVEKYGAKSASVVMMDPKTGAIIAMATYPNYDPNSFSDFPREYYKNPVVAESFEPGSTFKVLVMAAALNENLIKPDTKCDNCQGPVVISNYSIRTWNNKYYPDTTMTDVIIHSDNTGMVYVGNKLGLDKMYQYIQDFGFGNLTGVDLQDEMSPDIREETDWKEIDLATSSFGQGIAVTPLQMVRAISIIANGGYLMEPHIVKAIEDGGKVTEIKPKILGQPLSLEATKLITQMMVEAVDKGEAKNFVPKGFKIAGKTGTAQIPVAGHYDPEKTIASFIGFAPAEDPKFVMLVKYTEPSSSIFGAETAAPTFFEITKELLAYYNVAPN